MPFLSEASSYGGGGGGKSSSGVILKNCVPTYKI